jgi:hypothetical protein
MRYSADFRSLHDLTANTNSLTEVKYMRVAFFLSRFLISEHPRNEHQLWAKIFINRRDKILRHVEGMTELEWKMIQTAILMYADMPDSEPWRSECEDWIVSIENIRVFNRAI